MTKKIILCISLFILFKSSIGQVQIYFNDTLINSKEYSIKVFENQDTLLNCVNCSLNLVGEKAIEKNKYYDIELMVNDYKITNSISGMDLFFMKADGMDIKIYDYLPEKYASNHNSMFKYLIVISCPFCEADYFSKITE